MKYYKDIIAKKEFEDKYNIKLEDYNVYDKKYKEIDLIPSYCDNCGELFWVSTYTFIRRLCLTEYYSKNFGDTWFCQKPECVHIKKSLSAKRNLLENKQSMEKKRIYNSKCRKGKTYEQQYGKEKAEIVKSKIKKKRKEQFEPMKGRHHSDKSKLIMSLSKKELYSKNEKNWNNFITGELCSFKEMSSSARELWFRNPENKKYHLKKVLSGQMKSYRKREDMSKSRWFDNQKILCQSSYEKRYIDILNSEHIYFSRCQFIIPYRWNNKVKHYNPDFTLYKDKDCTDILGIVEVKPKLFLESDFIYSNKNQQKLKMLEIFCKYNNYKMIIITEEELNENKAY